MRTLETLQFNVTTSHELDALGAASEAIDHQVVAQLEAGGRAMGWDAAPAEALALPSH